MSIQQSLNTAIGTLGAVAGIKKVVEGQTKANELAEESNKIARESGAEYAKTVNFGNLNEARIYRQTLEAEKSAILKKQNLMEQNVANRNAWLGNKPGSYDYSEDDLRKLNAYRNKTDELEKVLSQVNAWEEEERHKLGKGTFVAHEYDARDILSGQAKVDAEIEEAFQEQLEKEGK